MSDACAKLRARISGLSKSRTGPSGSSVPTKVDADTKRKMQRQIRKRGVDALLDLLKLDKTSDMRQTVVDLLKNPSIRTPDDLLTAVGEAEATRAAKEAVDIFDTNGATEYVDGPSSHPSRHSLLQQATKHSV